MLSFTVKNRGKKDEWIGPWDFPSAIEEFFAVYRETTEGNGDLLIGKPFKTSGNTLDLAHQLVPGNDQIQYVVTWMSPEGKVFIMPAYSKPEKNLNPRHYQAVKTSPLSKGKYFSGFTLEHEGRKLAFRVEFEVR